MNGIALLLVSVLPAGGAPETKDVDYLRDVKPLLAARCFACHGAIKQKGGLRLDTAALLRQGGDSGPAVIPGKSEASLLVKRILGHGGMKRMPPESEGEPLRPAQVALIRQWIDGGAVAPKDEQPEIHPRDHWAFKQVVRPTVPKAKNAQWVRNPIDAFIAAEHEKQQLVPQPPAEKRLLLRRVSLDLIGLPPTRAEMDAFLNDDSPDAYEKVVDRLLASPQYGERWARHWMDVWRYSDWWGLGAELRNSQRHIWHWRDWIVESLNRDKGYDRMVLEMLAADELFPQDLDALRGTGFLARHYFLFNRTTWLDETIEHTSKAFLGLTMNCAKCHDHKYDPITQEDYYRFRAIFEPYQLRTDQVPGEIDFTKNGVPRAFDANLDAPTYLHIRGDEQRPDRATKITPGLPKLLAPDGLSITPVKLPPEAYHPGLRPFVLQDHLRVVEKELAAAREARKAASNERSAAVAQKQIAAAEQAIVTLKARAAADRAGVFEPGTAKAKELARQAALAQKKLAVAQAEVALARAEEEQAKIGAKAEAKVKQARAALDAARKALANPGTTYTPLRGSLKTRESNLESEASLHKPFPKESTGRRSALAKWIASRDNPLTARVAVNHIWMRHFGQPLVLTVFDFGRKGAKPTHPELLDWLAAELMDNQWSMKHIHKLIVTSSAYRMTSSSAGTAAANQQKDPDNVYYWRRNTQRMESQVVRDSLLHLAGVLDLTLGGPPVETPQQESSRRRSLYFFHSAIARNRFLTTFDDADPLDCYRRRESIVPQQALALSNSKLAFAMSEQIAQRLLASDGRTPAEGQSSDGSFAQAAFAWLLGYEPNGQELSACEEAMRRWRALQQNQSAAELRVRSLLIHALLNHNDFVTIR